MITLYHSPNTRSGGIVWLLEELDVPYETKLVTFRRADGTGEKDPANPHPHGKVPALHDDGETVFESSAIGLYLTDKYRKVRLGPAVGEPKRGEFLSWLAYRAGVMEPAFIERRLEITISDNGCGFNPSLAIAGNGLTNLRERLASLSGTCEISSQPGAGTTVTFFCPRPESPSL